MTGIDERASPEALRKSISARFAVRVHCALILVACFGIGLLVTKVMLVAGVQVMWLRYTVALVAAYMTFLLGVRIWLRYAGFDRRILPSRRSGVDADLGLPDVDGLGGGSSGGGGGSIFAGGGGRSGGGGASLAFGDGARAGPAQGLAQSLAPLSSNSHASSGGRFDGLDFDGDGLVLLVLLGLLLAVSGSFIWLIYAAPTILADAAFAALLSAGLVKSTKHIASGGWVESVVGHTWIAFGAVFAMALVFALVAQHRFPDAHTIMDVVRHL